MIMLLHKPSLGIAGSWVFLAGAKAYDPNIISEFRQEILQLCLDQKVFLLKNCFT